MSNTVLPPRQRGRTLLIVEGCHEKNELFPTLFRCYPELNIGSRDIWIYGTKIYELYQEIEKEYGLDWDQQDIDLPFLISNKQNHAIKSRMSDFTNILLVFDYERQDPFFDEDKIHRLQSYFSDPADMGKLYINYPMVESYLHFNCFPDPSFKALKIQAALKRGGEYKNLVHNTPVAKFMSFSAELDEQLNSVLGITNDSVRGKCLNALLASASEAELSYNIKATLAEAADARCAKSGEYYLPKLFNRFPFVSKGMNYLTYTRYLFSEIIRHNICKASYITGGEYTLENSEYERRYLQLDPVAILEQQNAVSRDTQTGCIWVLNTSVFFIVDFQFNLINPA